MERCGGGLAERVLFPVVESRRLIRNAFRWHSSRKADGAQTDRLICFRV
jgi:hypothetical protein